MPVFDQGYQHWQGNLSGHAWRWLAIARRGVKAQIGRRAVIAVVVLAWGPPLVLAALLAVWGLIEQQSTLIKPFLAMMRDLPRELLTDPHFFRTPVWTLCFDGFLRVEVFLAMILVLLVGPDLISQDLRFNAMPLYFSRPLRRLDYFFGKLGVIGFFLSLVTIVPAGLAYLLGVAFSLDFHVFADTARLMGGVLLSCVVIIVSIGTLMLAISSLSRSSRNVGAMWIGFWIVSNTMAAILREAIEKDWCAVVSLTYNLRRLCFELLDSPAAWEKIQKVTMPGGRPPGPGPFADLTPWTWSAGVLVGLFVISLFILHWRVRSLDRLG